MPVINITPETAVEVTALPYTQTLDVTDAPTGTGYASTCDANQYHAVWYRYTAQVGDTYIAVGIDRSSAGNFTPNISIWTGSLGSLAQFHPSEAAFCLTASPNQYINIPVTAGTTYYFQCTDNNNTAPLGGSLVFRLRGQAVAAVPIGAMFIPDDDDGFPAATVDANGGILQWLPLPAGEYGDTMPTGELCLQDGTAETDLIVVDTSTLTTIASISFGTDEIKAIKSDRSTYFYVLTRPAAGGAATVRKIHRNGTQSTTWTLPANSNQVFMAAAVTRDGTKFYYAKINTANEPIHMYNLQTSAAGADLVAGRATYSVAGQGDGYEAADGTLLFGFKINGGVDRLVERYNSAGVLQSSYDDPLDAQVHFAFNSDSPASFARRSDNNDEALFTVIQLSDGAVLSTSDLIPVADVSGLPNVAGEVYAISDTCPLVVLTAAIEGASVEPVVTYHTESLVERRLRRAPHLTSELKRQFVSMFQVHLQPGIGNTTGLGDEPVVMFRFSRDGGRTWSSERRLPAGAVGEYTRRCLTWQLGEGRDFVFEVAVTDPCVPWSIVAAYLEAKVGRN